MRLTFIILLLIVGTLRAQSGNVITFTVHGKPNSTYNIAIAEPLDGAYNGKAATFKQTIKDSSEVKFIPKQKYPAIISVDIAGRFLRLIIVPNNNIHVDIYPQINSNDGVVFRGDNANGQKFLNNYVPIESSINIQKIFKNNPKNYPTIYKEICKYVDLSLQQIDSLKMATSISDPFTEVLKKNKRTELCFWIINEYNGLLFGVKDSAFSAVDSIAIRDSQNKIFQTFSPLSPDILTYVFGSLYLNNYFVAIHQAKNSSSEGYLPVFGAWGQYGILPEVLRKPILGDAILYQYVYSVNQFDKEKAIDYFRKKYPDSEYLPQIDRFVEKAKQSQMMVADKNVHIENASVTKKQKTLKETLTAMPFDKAIHIDTSAVANNVKSLKELHETYFKGRKIFIDLWATWCGPCRAEFAYKDRVDSLLDLHNILPVFLSIDNSDLQQKWMHDVVVLKLSGYHFMVNEILKEDIRKTIYDSKPMIDIPQYIYMDEDGNIINKDAPRPSNIKELEKLFSQQ